MTKCHTELNTYWRIKPVRACVTKLLRKELKQTFVKINLRKINKLFGS